MKTGRRPDSGHPPKINIVAAELAKVLCSWLDLICDWLDLVIKRLEFINDLTAQQEMYPLILLEQIIKPTQVH